MNEPTIWEGCYDAGWQDLLTPDAFSHPAKMARGLVFRIISHLLDNGLIQPGQTVLDPFGGVGTTALPTLLAGLNYVGVELEPKFVELGRANIEMWQRKFSRMPKWSGQAVLLQGDSRRLVEVIAAAGGVVGSPPYAGSINARENQGDVKTEEDRKRIFDKTGVKLGGGQLSYRNHYGDTPGQLGAMPPGSLDGIVGSQPFTQSDLRKGGSNILEENAKRRGRNPYLPGTISNLSNEPYGNEPGNLGNLPPGNLSAVVGSPPWAGNSGGRGEASRNGIDPGLFDRHQGGMVGGVGETPGNLAGMVPGDVAGVVGSPPYEKSMDSTEYADKRAERANGFKQGMRDTKYGQNPFTFLSKDPSGLNNQQRHDIASKNPQVGALSGDTFWSAAAEILRQCAAVLPPGAPAVWVVKSFVKGGKLVDFPDQWRQLCEASGFETVEVIHAMLVKDNGAQLDLEGNKVRQHIERKSFFRRLHEAVTRAGKHWLTLSRDDQARLLAASRAEAWQYYHDHENDEEPAQYPGSAKIYHKAKLAAWLRDGKPHYDIATAIDHETVLVTVRRA